MDTAIEILKWVLLILLAGFIGQFGKSLSLRLIHYFQDKRGKKALHVTAGNQGAARTAGVASSEPGQKSEKKMLKAQIKLSKKREKLKSKDGE
jgi:hypothetical protein